jgi:hypothetical protein
MEKPAPRLNLLKVNFQELYERHLCRHSQYGLNLAHLATVVGCYLGIFGLLAWPLESPWVLAAVPLPYFAVLAFNVPLRVLLASVVFVTAFFAFFFAVSPLPLWLAVLLIPLCHLLQSWSHKVWTRERDMAEFGKKYKKGRTLFVLLSFYELPLLFNYLVFDRKNWSAGRGPVDESPGPCGAPPGRGRCPGRIYP